MKAQRRHELKTNALASRLESFPDYMREYGNKVLLVIIAFLLAFLGFRWYNQNKERQAQQLTSSLETLQSQLMQLDREAQAASSGIDAATLADFRQKTSATAAEAINNILSSAKDPNIIAHAYVAEGDLDWKLSNMPDPPGALTRPELKIPNRDALLDSAKNAYLKVLDRPYNQNQTNVFAARLGLAAIAENQGQWDEAKKQYQSIADAPEFPSYFKDVAKERMVQLAEYSKPVLLVPPPEPTVTPSGEKVFGPEAPPMSMPATAPMTSMAVSPPSSASHPNTQPSTRPAQ